MDVDSTLGKQLRDLRLGRGLTLDDLEEATGVTAPYLSKIERDQALPQRETLESIIRAVGGSAGILDERDQAELERLGYDPLAAKAIVEIQSLSKRKRKALLQRLFEDLQALAH